ncbi:Hypothetical_protein [Hexamita inflata]|uniref:Hypothetical_protein n=1 Tax=Hexamita inflata TaxID=28002 RepID=A0AA86U3Y0_9EUKA|nr:Hypothetical protein HINF_LOCUS24707 [Hexamita inflata]
MLEKVISMCVKSYTIIITVYEKSMNMLTTFLRSRTPSQANTAAVQRRALTKKPSCMKALSRRSKVRETVKLPEEGHRERHLASRVWEQGKKAKPKATLDRTGSEQPSTIEDMEHERVKEINISLLEYIQCYYNRNHLLTKWLVPLQFTKPLFIY